MKPKQFIALAAIVAVVAVGSMLAFHATAADPFDNLRPGLTSPAYNGKALTAVDGSVTTTTRGIYVGSGGTLVVTMDGGAELTFTNVPDGAILPIRVENIESNGTTASGLIGMW